MNNVRPLARRPLPTNKLADEGPASHLREVTMHSLTNAVVAHRMSTDATNESEKAIQDSLLMAHIGVVACAVSLRGFETALYKAIVEERIRDPRKLHRMAVDYETPDAA